MIYLIRKEISYFFSSLAAYVVIGLFFIATGLFLWIIPEGYNIMDAGYADLSAFFEMAPVLFLFLIPAISMRLIAEERKTGTLELLLSRPISTFTIVLSKFLSALLIVFITIIPSLLYVVSIYYLSDPVGNIDLGNIIGSYIGLLFLSSIFVSVSLFASSLTDNQIIAFVIGLSTCFIFYAGFDFIASVPDLYTYESHIKYLGISNHYSSMSRGVLDTRDIIWFGVTTYLFLYLSKVKIDKLKA